MKAFHLFFILFSFISFGNETICAQTNILQDQKGPRLLSISATASEEKASYSKTTWIHVNWFRVVSTNKIETREDNGVWTKYLDAPSSQRSLAIASCRTMEKASYSNTTWIRLHVFLLTEDGSIWKSTDKSPWELFISPDNKKVIGIASASHAEKASYSKTTYWNINLFRLLADGSIETSKNGDAWIIYSASDGKKVKAISATASREKASYSKTTWWTINIYRLLDNGDVEESIDGSQWKLYKKMENTNAIAAYTVETKASYSSTTWAEVHIEGASDKIY